MDILASTSSSFQAVLGFPSRRDTGLCHPEVPTSPPVLSGEREKELGKMKLGSHLNPALV